MDILSLLISISIPVGLGFVGSLLSNAGKSDWYKNLKKPSWTPPNWAFPVVWTILYIFMGVSSWLVWLQGGFKVQATPLTAYAIQLVLNFFWTPLFFGLHLIGVALVEIVFLTAAVAATIYLFWHVNTLATYLLMPYISWLILATSLNFYIWSNNGTSTTAAKKSS